MGCQTNTEYEIVHSLGGGGHVMIDANIGGSMSRQTNTESEFIPSLGGGSVPELPAAFSSEINQLNKLMDDLSCEEGDVKEQLRWLESRGKKCKRQVDVWLEEVQDLKVI